MFITTIEQVVSGNKRYEQIDSDLGDVEGIWRSHGGLEMLFIRIKAK